MFFKNKKILIIGGTGTIGYKLVLKLLEADAKVIRVYSRDEYKQFMMQNEFGENKKLRFLLGDIRDKDRLDRAMNDIDIIFHLAAIKHVPAAEYNPFEAVKTNVLGTQNVIECAIKNNVKRIIYTSSDKAVSPTNTMGATKLLAERLIASADYYKGDQDIVFAAVRFGNVMGSRGSVIPLWKKQIIDKGVLTITEPQMTRFMMTINDAVELTLRACEKAEGGEVFVLKMPVMKLEDLAEVVREEVCIKHGIDKKNMKIKKIGLRSGEKMYEELMNIKEMSEAVEYENMFAIIPTHKLDQVKSGVLCGESDNYSSENQRFLKREEIKSYLLENNLI